VLVANGSPGCEEPNHARARQLPLAYDRDMAFDPEKPPAPAAPAAPATPGAPAAAAQPEKSACPAESSGRGKPFRWTERRAARLVTMLVSGAVVLADIYLLLVVLGTDPAALAGWKPFVLMGIAAVFLFAMYRFRRQLRLFLDDQ
jgi:hypothetical protein